MAFLWFKPAVSFWDRRHTLAFSTSELSRQACRSLEVYRQCCFGDPPGQKALQQGSSYLSRFKVTARWWVPVNTHGTPAPQRREAVGSLKLHKRLQAANKTQTLTWWRRRFVESADVRCSDGAWRQDQVTSLSQRPTRSRPNREPQRDVDPTGNPAGDPARDSAGELRECDDDHQQQCDVLPGRSDTPWRGTQGMR